MSSIQYQIIYKDIQESAEAIHGNIMIQPHEVTHSGLFRLVLFVN